MRFTEWIGNPDDYVERHAIKPRFILVPSVAKKANASLS
jgi:hypothetical protein